MKKIILLASERSGTNLLRTLLGNHPNIDAPVAPHFLDAFSDSIGLYGDLKKKENAARLLGHMIKLANHSYHNWNLKTDASELCERYGVNSLASAFDAVYSERAKLEGKDNYACKDNHMFNYVSLLERLPDATDIRYIYLYRDPRDNVVSWMKRPLYMHTPYEMAKKWNAEQRTILDLVNKVGINAHFLKYENLIANPAQEMTRVLEFIGVSADEKCFQTDENNKESKRNEYWENLSKPIMSDNSKKYLKEMSAKDLLVVESVCAEPMKVLGYQPETAANWKKKKDLLFKPHQKVRIFLSKKKNKDHLFKTMADMQDKIDMINKIKQDL